MNKRIFIDLDGVVANWQKQALTVLGIDQSEMGDVLKLGAKIEDLVPEIWDKLAQYGVEFWTDLELFPWAKELYSRMNALGEVAFLTSGGNLHRRTDAVGLANYGKTKWVAEHFPGSHLILTREKHYCANPNSILIDDTLKKIDKFKEYGGQTFHWPHPYKFLDGDIRIEEILGKLEKKVVNMN